MSDKDLEQEQMLSSELVVSDLQENEELFGTTTRGHLAGTTRRGRSGTLAGTIRGRSGTLADWMMKTINKRMEIKDEALEVQQIFS